MIPQIKRILYATDLSPNSVYALRYAMNSAQKYGAKLIFLHVLEELSPTAIVLTRSYLNNEDFINVSEGKTAHAQKCIRKRLEAMCEKELQSDPEVEGIFESIEVVNGYPADEILAKADEFNCDVIFMGTHGKGFLKHPYFGSTSKKVLRRSRKPVFIIPLPEWGTDMKWFE